jgi:dihydrofolate reductase
MRKIISNVFISLDGVIDGLEEWHFPYFNDEMGAAVDAVFSSSDTLLLGRKTYEDHAAAWPEREEAGDEDAEFAKMFGDARKLVVSRQRPELTWRNSEHLQGDLVQAATALKNEPGDRNIAISGSVSVV